MPEYRRRLPHFHPDHAYLFFTWRLWGSLPAQEKAVTYPSAGHAFVAKDRELDRRSSGPRWLQQPAIADLVAATILGGDYERQFYELYAWTVMPNHVHLLVLPLVAAPVLMKWLKGTTARQANQLLRRTGQAFWQDESYDHWVRSRREFERIIQYIDDNPVSAGLADAVGQWPWCSARGQAEACPTKIRANWEQQR
jgi:REP element-mobilizing transposase RayT